MGSQGGQILSVKMLVLNSLVIQQLFYMPHNLSRALRKGAVSSKVTGILTFLLSSNNDCVFFHMLDWMFTKLGQKHVWVYGYKTYGSKNSPGVIWGHKGQKR